jgi:PKD repeat protein
MSTCNADSYSWEFEGGSPATSSDVNPQVTYSTTGDFDVSLTVTNATGSHTLTMTEYIHVGVGNIELALENISVMPNPSNGYFKIHNPNQEQINIAVYSVLGKLIKENTSNELDYSLDLIEEQNGIYLLQIIIDGEAKTIRIIKQ